MPVGEHVREVLARHAADVREVPADVVAAGAVGDDREDGAADVGELRRAQARRGVEHDAAAGRRADAREVAAEEDRVGAARERVDRAVGDERRVRQRARRRRLRQHGARARGREAGEREQRRDARGGGTRAGGAVDLNSRA